MEPQEDYSLLGCKNKQELKEYLERYEKFKETTRKIRKDALYIII